MAKERGGGGIQGKKGEGNWWGFQLLVMQGPTDSTTKHDNDDDEGKAMPQLYKTSAEKEHLLPLSHIDR